MFLSFVYETVSDLLGLLLTNLTLRVLAINYKGNVGAYKQQTQCDASSRKVFVKIISIFTPLMSGE